MARNSSIVSGTLPLALFGAEGYGGRQGMQSSARLLVGAFSPFAFSMLSGIGGAHTALWLYIAAGCASTAAFVSIWLMVRATPRD